MNLPKIAAAASAAALLTLATGCELEESSQASEAQTQQAGYDALVANQPAGAMSYSPTRETINFWIDTWDEPNKLSFVYLQSPDGTVLGYYVLKGLPVSYCAMLTPTYEIEGSSSSTGGMAVVPAPGMDGAYYSGGGSCDTYYGQDATTGSYLEYTAGLGINVLLYDQPLTNGGFADAEPLGPTHVDDLEELED